MGKKGTKCPVFDSGTAVALCFTHLDRGDTTRMRSPSLNLRWGKVVTWGLLAVAGVGALAVLFFLFPRWRSARGDAPGSAVVHEEKEPPRLKRLDEHTLLVPPEVQRALDLHTA